LTVITPSTLAASARWCSAIAAAGGGLEVSTAPVALQAKVAA